MLFESQLYIKDHNLLWENSLVVKMMYDITHVKYFMTLHTLVLATEFNQHLLQIAVTEFHHNFYKHFMARPQTRYYDSLRNNLKVMFKT